MTPHPKISDHERGEFLRKLDGCELMVSDWEAAFIASFLSKSPPSFFWTDNRRVSADKMRMKYGFQPGLEMPMPAN